MVKENKHGYMCEECYLTYKNKKIAEKCEAWCKKNKSCNLKITCYSIQRQGGMV